jgi:hypothetical protein
MLPGLPNAICGVRDPVITGIGAIRFERFDGYFQSYRLFGL